MSRAHTHLHIGKGVRTQRSDPASRKHRFACRVSQVASSINAMVKMTAPMAPMPPSTSMAVKAGSDHRLWRNNGRLHDASGWMDGRLVFHYTYVDGVLHISPRRRYDGANRAGVPSPRRQLRRDWLPQVQGDMGDAVEMRRCGSAPTHGPKPSTLAATPAPRSTQPTTAPHSRSPANSTR